MSISVLSKKISIKIMTILLCLLFACTLFFALGLDLSKQTYAVTWDGTSADFFAGGSGTEADPYQIATAEQLMLLSDIINSDVAATVVSGGAEVSYATLCAAYYELTADVVLNDATFIFQADTGLVEVSDGTNTAYLGTGIKGDTSGSNTDFDTTASVRGSWYDSLKVLLTTQPSAVGNSVSVENMLINVWQPIGDYDSVNDAYYDFAGHFDGNNHTVSGMYVNETDDESYVGVFARIHGENVSNRASVKNLGVVNSYANGGRCVASIVGNSGTNGEILNCYNTGFVSGYMYSGGIVGEFSSDVNVSNCDNSGSVYGGTYVGGITGYCSYEVFNCDNSGTVYGGTCVGGIIGYGYSSSTIANCYNSGKVTGTGGNVGGIAGDIDGDAYVDNSYNTGSVKGGENTGGIVGLQEANSAVENSYNVGTVTGTSFYVGGVTGFFDDSAYAENCYYLENCATDSSGKAQFGFGADTVDTTTADVNGTTNSIDATGAISATEDIVIYHDDTADSYTVSNGDPISFALSGWITMQWNESTYTTWAPDGNYAKFLSAIASVSFDANADGTVSASEITEYYSFEEAWNATVALSTTSANRAVVKLCDNVSASSGSFGTGIGFGLGSLDTTGYIFLDSNKYVTLDLNGYTINRGLTAAHESGSGFILDVTGDLLLIDSAGGGKIKGGYGTPSAVKVNGTFTMQGGTICGNQGSGSSGCVSVHGTFIMQGGTITGNKCMGVVVESTEGAKLYVSGDAVISNNWVSGTLNAVSGMYEQGLSGTAKNVSLYSERYVQFGDGDATNGEAEDVFSGEIGISSNWFPSVGYPVLLSSGYADSGTKDAEDKGTIYSDNADYAISVNGDELQLTVRISHTVTLELDGGTFDLGPNVLSYYEGVGLTLPTADVMSKTGYTFDGWYTDNLFTGSAVTEITSGSTDDKVFYAKWTVIVTAITLDKNGGDANGEVTATYFAALTDYTAATRDGYTLKGYYTAETDGTLIINADGTLVGNVENYTTAESKWAYANTTLKLYAQWTTLAAQVSYIDVSVVVTTSYASFGEAWNAAIALVSTSENKVTVKLFADVTAVEGSFGTGAGFGTGGASGTGYITVPVAEFIILDLNGNTIDRAIASSTLDGFVIKVNGNLEIKDSIGTGVITGGYCSSYGGGVYVDGTFTFSGGTISGNTAGYNGGGVYMDSASSFTMTGGTISGNTAMYGGGVYNGIGTFTMSGGTISGNTAGSLGGGMYIVGTFTMSGGTISGNNARESGGGMYIRGDCTTISGGTISGNNATATGGGIHFYSLQLTLSGNTTVTSNYVGGTLNNGVYVQGSGSASNIHLFSGEVITISAFSGTAGVTTHTNPDIANSILITSGWGTNRIANTGTLFADNSTRYELTKNGSGEWMLGIKMSSDYTVTLVEGDGASYASGYIEPTLYTQGTGLMLPDGEDILRTGYVFGGWFENEECNGTAVTAITTGDTGNKTYYAKWSLIVTAITLNSNGGTADGSATATYMDNMSNYVAATYDGKILNGYYTLASGGTMIIDMNGNLISAIDGYVAASGEWTYTSTTLTLYAQWAEEATFAITIIFNGNGADGGTMKSQDVERATATPLTENAYTRSGYTFAGWATSANGEVTYLDKASITIETSVVLYAVWTENNEYTITYVLNGGSGATYGTYNENCDTIILPTQEVMTKEGYSFAGWYVYSNFTGMAVTKIHSGTVGDLTFYAKWVSDGDFGKEFDGLDDDKKEEIMNLIVEGVDAVGYVIVSADSTDTVNKYIKDETYATLDEAVAAASTAQLFADGDDNVSMFVGSTLAEISTQISSISTLVSSYETKYAEALSGMTSTENGYVVNGVTYDTLAQAVNAVATQVINDIIDEAKTEIVGEVESTQHSCDGTLISTQLDMTSSNIDNVDLDALTIDVAKLSEIFSKSINGMRIRKYYQEILNLKTENYNVALMSGIYTAASLYNAAVLLPSEEAAGEWVSDLEDTLYGGDMYLLALNFFESESECADWMFSLSSSGVDGELGDAMFIGLAKLYIDKEYNEWKSTFTSTLKMTQAVSVPDTQEGRGEDGSLVSNGEGFAGGDVFSVTKEEIADTTTEAVKNAINTINVAYDSPEVIKAVKALRNAEIIAAYDLKLTDANGNVYTEFNDSVGSVTVTIKIPEGLEYYKNISIVYLTPEGEIEYYDCEVVEGYITFVTTHFSQYYLVAKAPVSLWWMAVPVVLIALLIAAYVFVDKKSKTEK